MTIDQDIIESVRALIIWRILWVLFDACSKNSKILFGKTKKTFYIGTSRQGVFANRGIHFMTYAWIPISHDSIIFGERLLLAVEVSQRTYLYLENLCRSTHTAEITNDQGIANLSFEISLNFSFELSIPNYLQRQNITKRLFGNYS